MHAAAAHTVTIVAATDPNDPPAYLGVRGTLPQRSVAVVRARAETSATHADGLATLLQAPILSALALGMPTIA